MEGAIWGDGRGKKGRPPDLWNSVFISNLVTNKLDIIGNVTDSGEICSDFKLKLQNVEGFTENLFREVKGMLSNFLKALKKKGVTPKNNFRASIIIKSFTYYNSADMKKDQQFPRTKFKD